MCAPSRVWTHLRPGGSQREFQIVSGQCPRFHAKGAKCRKRTQRRSRIYQRTSFRPGILGKLRVSRVAMTAPETKAVAGDEEIVCAHYDALAGEFRPKPGVDASGHQIERQHWNAGKQPFHKGFPERPLFGRVLRDVHRAATPKR